MTWYFTHFTKGIHKNYFFHMIYFLCKSSWGCFVKKQCLSWVSYRASGNRGETMFLLKTFINFLHYVYHYMVFCSFFIKEIIHFFRNFQHLLLSTFYIFFTCWSIFNFISSKYFFRNIPFVMNTLVRVRLAHCLNRPCTCVEQSQNFLYKSENYQLCMESIFAQMLIETVY